MVKVTLKDGTVVVVPGGIAGFWDKQVIRNVIETPVDTGYILNIKDSTASFSGKIVASFKAEEVVGYVVEDEALPGTPDKEE